MLVSLLNIYKAFVSTDQTRLRTRRFYSQRLINPLCCEHSLYFIFELSLCIQLYLKHKDQIILSKPSIKQGCLWTGQWPFNTIGTAGKMANLFAS